MQTKSPDSYSRWEILSTITMKWLDLTIQQVRRA